MRFNSDSAVYAPDFGSHEASDLDADGEPLDGCAQSGLVSVRPVQRRDPLARRRVMSDRAGLPGPVVEAIRAIVEKALADRTTPGMAVAVTDAEGTLFSSGFGLAEVASGRPVDPTTLFEIGSIGKSFTAFCVMALADEGRLTPDDPVVRHLAWFEVRPATRGAPPITLHHLLSHTAGITAGIDATPEPASQVWALRHLRPSAPPGARFHYSNVGYKALGLVLEAIEQRPYPAILADRILGPLGMLMSEPEITNEIRERLAVGYTYLHDDRVGHPGIPLVPATWLETATADGSIAATADDMAAYARLLLGRGTAGGVRVVGEASFARMTAPHAVLGPDATYGYGLTVRRDGDRLFVGHGGGMVGYLAGVQVDPDAGIGAVVLQNGYGAGPVTLARRIVRLVADAMADAGAGAGGGGDAGHAGRGPGGACRRRRPRQSRRHLAASSTAPRTPRSRSWSGPVARLLASPGRRSTSCPGTRIAGSRRTSGSTATCSSSTAVPAAPSRPSSGTAATATSATARRRGRSPSGPGSRRLRRDLPVAHAMDDVLRRRRARRSPLAHVRRSPRRVRRGGAAGPARRRHVPRRRGSGRARAARVRHRHRGAAGPGLPLGLAVPPHRVGRNSIESMDLGFTLQARCLEAVANGSVGPEHCVVPVPRSIDEQVARAYVDLAT